jgi:hypothetical protein
MPGSKRASRAREIVAVLLGVIVLTVLGVDSAAAADDPPAQPIGMETSWKTGSGWTARPPSEIISRFSPRFAKPASWLKSINRLPEGMRIVVSDNPDLNCGMNAGITVGPSDVTAVSGCYRYEYGKTIFLFWGKKATTEMKEFVLLHELSHFEQQWDQFDLVISAYDSDIPRETLSRILETDATCRVYDEWHLPRYRRLDAEISAPCGNADWNEGWLAAKFRKYGVTVNDW